MPPMGASMRAEIKMNTADLVVKSNDPMVQPGEVMIEFGTSPFFGRFKFPIDAATADRIANALATAAIEARAAV